MDVGLRNIGVVSANGLGDGLIALVLSHNLQLNGAEVTTYNNSLCQLKEWFPTHKIAPHPTFENVDQLLTKHDHIFSVGHSVASKLTSSNLTMIKESHLKKEITWIKNLENYCRDILKLKFTTSENGIMPPTMLKYKRFLNRIAIHPTSTECKRDWLPEKFIKLASKLSAKGFQPFFCIGPHERDFWNKILPKEIESPAFQTLFEAAAFIFESGYLIGVNSGLGHLASNLGIPTLSLFARMSYARLWRPGWTNNLVVTPPPLLIGSSLKHRYWKKCLTVRRVMKNFGSLTKKLERVERKAKMIPSLHHSTDNCQRSYR